MAVLQFGFGDPGAHIHLPHTFTKAKVVYTGTHDNDTVLGWWNSAATEQEKRHVHSYLGPCEDGVHWGMIRAALNSVAALSVIPMQDVLGLGSEGRMNVPSCSDGNWCWRYRGEMLRPELAEKLAVLTEVADRLPPPISPPIIEDWSA
jgi:4-alpha-glucanotransferase